jgi:hypothetical protein
MLSNKMSEISHANTIRTVGERYQEESLLNNTRSLQNSKMSSMVPNKFTNKGKTI